MTTDRTYTAAAHIRLILDAIAALPMDCEWYPGCRNDAAGAVAHPILGAVPTCRRCADRHDLVLVTE